MQGSNIRRAAHLLKQLQTLFVVEEHGGELPRPLVGAEELEYFLLEIEGDSIGPDVDNIDGVGQGAWNC